jgi:ATP-binding cassette subfamily C protein LapB
MNMNTSDIGAAPDMHAVPFAPELLARLFDKLGVAVEAGALRHACDTVQTGAMAPVERLGRIMQAAQQRGMKAALMPWARFDRRSLPALAFVGGAWCLMQTGDGGDVLLVGQDGRTLPHQEQDLLEAQVLWLQAPRPEQKDAPADTGSSPAARLIVGELLRSKRWIVDVLIATLMVNILAVLTSLYSMQVYDRVVPSFSYSTMWALTVGLLIALAVDWVLKYIRARLLDSVSKRVDQEVSQQLFEHMLRLRLDKRPRSIGSLAAQVNGLESARAFFSSVIVFALTDMPFALMFIGFIAIIGGKVALVYLLLLPFALGLGWMAQLRLRRLSRDELRRSTERQGLLVESIQGAEAIQSLGAGWRFAQTWRAITATMAAHSTRSKQITSVMTTTAGTLSTLAYTLAIVVGVYEIEAGNLTTGGLVASTFLGGRIIGPLAQCVQMLAQWQQVSEALNMVSRLLQLEPSRAPQQSLMLTDARPDKLEFEGIRFSYEQAPVLRLNIPKLSFKAGDRVVLLGAIGSGKSTLLKVAAGLYRPSEGRVRVGNADLWELDPQVVVNHVAYLAQDVHLFKGSLRSNLALAGTASDTRLLEVSNMLGVDQIAADNPRSMDMEISEGGDGLSGGQRQLVGLSRVVLAQPAIWLLDEPTASLDSEAEQRVINTLNTVVKPEDILIIATHRTSLLSLANRVIMMRRGEVIMDDSPEAIRQATARKAQAVAA